MFEIKKILTDEMVNEVLEDSMEMSEGLFDAGVTNGDTTDIKDPYWRTAQENSEIHPDFYPNINKKLLEAISSEREHYIHAYNYIIYTEGSHFRKHHDYNETMLEEDNPRWGFITPTLLSDDLEGGDLKVWDKEGKEHSIILKVGETLMFRPWVWHEVSKTIKGRREVLVAWAHWKKV